MKSLWGQKKWMYPFPASFWNIANNLGGRFDGFSIIHIFEIFEKRSSDHFQKCVTKFQKLKIWDVHFLCFSVPFVIAFKFLIIGYIFWW